MELFVDNIGSKKGKIVEAKLAWEKPEGAEFYMVFKRKPGEEWQSISTFDFLDQKPVRVLNAYPRPEDCDYSTTTPEWISSSAKFKFKTGESTTTSKSASLKLWMEGGSINGEVFENLGRNMNDENVQSIEVDIFPIEYVNDNPKLIWNYDIFIPGIWDGSGSAQGHLEFFNPVCNMARNALLSELERYLDAKYSVIASHDAISRATGTFYAMGTMREHFGIAVGGHGIYDDMDETGVPMKQYWSCWSTKVKVVKQGPLVYYPWTIPDAFSVYNTHTWGNIATSSIWARFELNEPCMEPFEYTHSGAVDFYLTTKNNTAMIQTGHTAANATLEERKLFANLIYFLKQRTTETQRHDYSSLDEDPPEAPANCHCEIYPEDYKFHCEGRDSQTIYEYKVAAYDSSNEVISTSQTVTVDMASNFSHFVYACDNQKSATKLELRNSGTVSYGETISITNPASYFHVMAVDGSGNEGPVVDYPVKKCIPITPVFEMTRSQQHAFFVLFGMPLYRFVIY